MSKEIKVTVDYANGCYNVTGLRDGKPYTLSKPIRGRDVDGIYRENFSTTLRQERQERMKADIRSLLITDRGFRFSRRALNDVDPTMYAALSDWDRMNRTNYARRYLRSIVEEYGHGKDKKLSRDELRTARKMTLADRGIEITYNVGIFNTDKKMRLIDKLKGIIMAFRQRNSIGADVYSSFRLNDILYLNDPEEILDGFDDEEVHDQGLDEEQPHTETRTQSQSQSKSTYRGDRIYWERPTKAKETEEPKKPDPAKKPEPASEPKKTEPVKQADSTSEPTKKQDSQKRTVKDSAKTMKNPNRLPRHKRIQAQKKKMRSETPQQRNARLTAEKNKRREQIHKAQAAKAERERKEAEAQAKLLEEEERRRQQEEARAEEDRKRFEDAERAVQKIVEDEQRFIEESQARAEQERQEKEAKAKREAEARAKREEQSEKPAKQSEEAKRQFESGALAKAVATLSGAVVAARGKFKGIFSDKLKARKSDREDSGFIFDEEDLEGDIEEPKKPAVKRTRKPVPKIEKPKTEKPKKVEKVKKEPKDKKKLSLNIKDSLNKTKTGRRINAGIRHYKRKLRGVKDSIKNFKFKPNERFRKIVIRGAVGIAAAAILFSAVYPFGKTPSKAPSDPGYTIEETTPGTTENPTVDIEIDPNGQPGGTETTSPEETKPSETETEKPGETETQKPGETETQKPNVDESQKPSTETPGIVSPGETEQPGETETQQPGETETQQPGETETQQPGGQETEQPGETETGKTDEEKLEEFKQEATQKYMDEFVIGEKPEVGDMLQDKVYWEKPDGTGKFGYFESHPDYTISHINIIQESGWTVVRADGRSLPELLAEYPECIDYNVHFVNSKTGGGLGFVTKAQLESMIKDKVDSIIQSRTVQNNPTQNQENPDIER